MAPFIVLVAAFGVTLLVTGRRDRRRPDLTLALRVAVAAMFLVSGTSHFVGMRKDLIAMVPEPFPMPDVIITITGVLELAADAAMVSRPLSPWAAAGLSLLLVAMFPANVDLALSGTDLSWNQTLVPRTIMQVVFVAATSTLAIRGFAARRRSSDATSRDGAAERGPMAL